MKKLLIIIVIILILTFSSFFFVKEKNTNKIPIITFHRLVPNNIKMDKYKNNEWVGSIDVFQDMMQYLHDNNYKTLSSNELYEWLNKKIELPKKTVMITFDDGFYEDYYLVYPILKEYDFKAITFVVGSRIKDITEEYEDNKTAYIGLDKIEEIRKDYPNFEIQSHSYDLHYYTKNGKHKIKSITKENLELDIKNNNKYNFDIMAYPFGDYNAEIKNILKNNNYKMAFRFTPSAYVTRDSDLYALPRIKMNGNSTLRDLKKWLN